MRTRFNRQLSGHHSLDTGYITRKNKSIFISSINKWWWWWW